MIRRTFCALAFALCCVALAACRAEAQTAPPAARVACPQFTYAGQPPQAQAVDHVLCFHAFVVGYSAVARDPIWSAEHLTADGVKAALAAKRFGDFHADTDLPPDKRAELADYRCAPYDRGHMTPVGDFGVPSDENDTFSLANMVPQDPVLNEHLWATIEKTVRELSGRDGEVWIVTGPLFDAAPKLLNGRVAIPAFTWKAVYDPKIGAVAFIAVNDASGQYQTITLQELADRLGFDPMPGVVGAERAVLPDVTVPPVKVVALPPRPCKAH